ncbi:MAG: hypothetical protein QNI91_07210 [Arenicellales bacterium]|nr:hypothetical protein [Arenicellales bacterium]
MKLKNYRLTFLGLVLFATGAWAQSVDIMEEIKNASPQERAEAQAEVLTDVLELTPRQAEKLVEINLNYSNQIQQMIDKGVQDDVLFTSIQELSRRKDEEIKGLLTKEQIYRYEAHKVNLQKMVEDVIQKHAPK